MKTPEALREEFAGWRSAVAKQPDADELFDNRFLKLRQELESRGWKVELDQDFLTNTHLLHHNQWNRTVCRVVQGGKALEATELHHNARARVSALFECFLKVLEAEAAAPA